MTGRGSAPCVYVRSTLPSRSLVLLRPPGSHVHALARNAGNLLESRAREERKDARGSAVRARLTEGESRYWEQSAGEVCSPRLPPPSLSLSLHPLAAAFCLSLVRYTRPLFTLPPPPPPPPPALPPVALPSLSFLSFFPIFPTFSFFQFAPSRSLIRISLSPSPSLAPIVQVFSLSRTLILSLSLSLSPRHSLSAPVRRGAGAKRTKPKLKLGCRLLRLLCCLLLTTAAAAAAVAATLPASLTLFPFNKQVSSSSTLSFLLSSFLTFLPPPRPSLILSILVGRTQRNRPKESLASLHRTTQGLPRSTRRHCPKLVGEMARHSFRHRNQLARLLFHTATHPLRDHRSHPTCPPLSFCVPDESRTREWVPDARLRGPFGRSGSESLADARSLRSILPPFFNGCQRRCVFARPP